METPTTPPREERVRNISQSPDATPLPLHHQKPFDRSTPLSKYNDVNNLYQDTFEEAADATPKAIRTRSLTERRLSSSIKKHDLTGDVEESAAEKENVLPATNDGPDRKSGSLKIDAVDELDEVNLGDGKIYAISTSREELFC